MNISEWAKRWDIPLGAMHELAGHFDVPPNFNPIGISEGAVQQRVRLQASKQGTRLWRNNVGVLTDNRGVPVRYGLANESKAMNKQIKSSDLIGITPIVITPEMVFQTIGVFTAYECKRGNWQWSGSEHEEAQRRYLQLVASMGGISKFITAPEDLDY